MKIKKDLLIDLRKKTNASFINCLNSLKNCNWNLKEAENFLNNKLSKFNINNLNLKFYIINLFLFKNLAVIIKLSFDNDFIIKNFYIKYITKKIIYLIIKKIPKNTKELIKLKIKNIKLKDKIENIRFKIKENIIINKFCFIKSKFKIKSYLYNNKFGLILEYTNGNDNILKDICMHIIALKTNYFSIKNILLDFIINQYYNIKIKFLKINKSKDLKKILIEKNVINLLKSLTLFNQRFIKKENLILEKLLKFNKIVLNKYSFF